MCPVYGVNVFSMLSALIVFWYQILIVVANLFMHSLPGMIILYLAEPFYTKGVFAWD